MEDQDDSWAYAKLSFQSLGDNNRSRVSRSFKNAQKSPRPTRKAKASPRSDHVFALMDDSAAPVDRHSRIYVAFLLSGIGYMLPFTCFIAAVDYYQDRFPQTTIIFDMTAATIIIGTLGVILSNALVETLSLTWRVMIGYIMSTSLLLFLTIFDVTMRTFRQDTGYWVTLVAVSIIAVGCAIQQSSFYGYANMLPRRYTQAVMVGESIAGVIVSLNRIITKLLLEDERVNTIIFFMVSIVIIVVCCCTFFLARQTTFVRHHLHSCSADKRRHENNGIDFTMAHGPMACYEFEVVPDQSCAGEGELHSQASSSERELSLSSNPHILDAGSSCVSGGRTSREITEENPEVAFKGNNSIQYGSSNRRGDDIMGSTTSLVKEGQSAFKARLLARWEVTKQIYPFMTSFGLTFYVTVSLYPGIISEVVSCKLGSWMPVLLMACFNFTDATGKIVTSMKQNFSKLRLFLCSLSRLCLVPLAIMCCTPRLQPVLSGEAWSVAVTLILGLSNGYFGSLPLVLAPSQVAPRFRELCGNTMMLSFTVAIICGAFTSYGLDLFVGPHPDLTFNFCHGLLRNDSAVNGTTLGHKLKNSFSVPFTG